MPDSTRLLTDAALLFACRTDHYRGSGPGGQKRNKTSNAVRLVHLPTGVSATATEDRSTVVNQLHALRRLKIKLAAELREPVDLIHFEAPDWFVSVRHESRLNCSRRHPLYAAVAGLMLDVLLALAANPAAVAINLGISSTAVVRHLHGESAWWTAANAMRKAAGQPPLKPPGSPGKTGR